MPSDAVIPFVSVQPTPGWTAAIERRTLDEPVEGEDGAVTEVVSKITWTGGTVAPGEFQEFSISAGQLPTDKDALEFPAIQTYSSGEGPARPERQTGSREAGVRRCATAGDRRPLA
jgi:periplasmic copper chaperone A